MKFKVGDLVLAKKKDKWRTSFAEPYASHYDFPYFLERFHFGVAEVLDILNKDKLVVGSKEKGGYYFSEEELVLLERRQEIYEI